MPSLTTTSTTVTDIGDVTSLRVGVRVRAWRHHERYPAGEAMVANVYGALCDVRFRHDSFGHDLYLGVPSADFYVIEDYEMDRERELSRLRVLAEAKKLLRQQQEKGLQADLDQLQLFASISDITGVMDKLLLLLSKGQTDSKWQDALNKFWTDRTPIAGCEPLYCIAPPWWKEWFWRNVRFTPLTLQEKIKVLSQPLLRLSDKLRRELAQEIVDSNSLNASFCEVLRDASLRLRFEILLALPEGGLQTLESFAMRALAEVETVDASLLPPQLVKDFWSKYGEGVPTHSPLFPFAPKHIQRKILRTHFQSHLGLIDSLFCHNAHTSGNWKAKDVYSRLIPEDEELAACWSNGVGDDHEMARMLSARAAEVVASWFYGNFGFTVIDVARHQLSGKSTRWKTHDIEFSEGGRLKPIDVKNARLPVHSEAIYVEHTVPRFKKSRNDREVKIVGVVSPYLTLKFLRHPELADFEVSDVRFLGETSLGAITRISAKFSQSLEVHDAGKGAFIPPWYFDFPNAWYQAFDEICAELRQIAHPDESEMQILYEAQKDTFPLPHYLAARLPLPAWLLNSMEPWLRETITKLQQLCTPRTKLAHLFLFLLSDFLTKIQKPFQSSYEPLTYLKLLYHGAGSDGGVTSTRPLGIEDPLGTIHTLVHSLQQLWTERQHLNLVRFKEYRLSGGGILQGREGRIHGNPSPWVTVLAFCGGKIAGKGKCGCAPLILGREDQCFICQKLICRKCGYCSEGCERAANFPSIAR